MIVTQVWGCGGSSASQAQQQQRKWELKDTQKHKDRKVCMDSCNLLLLIVRSFLLATYQIVIASVCVLQLKIEDWKDNPDRMILEMGGVTTEHAEK